MGKTSEIFCYRSYRLRHLLFLLHRRHHGLLLLVLLAVHCEKQRCYVGLKTVFQRSFMAIAR